VFRNLAASYLGRQDLPPTEAEDPAEAAGTGLLPEAGLLPLDLPAASPTPGERRRLLRLVAK
jgi:hypothetical protein